MQVYETCDTSQDQQPHENESHQAIEQAYDNIQINVSEQKFDMADQTICVDSKLLKHTKSCSQSNIESSSAVVIDET